jgi:hypothetical protein
MYLDLDEGTVRFGSDTSFYGTAFTGVFARDTPLYPIVTGTSKGAIIGIVYRGEGNLIMLVEMFTGLTFTNYEKMSSYYQLFCNFYCNL